MKPKRGVLKYGEVYTIYEGDRPIYVGSAGKGKHTLRYRFGDLFSEYRGNAGEKKYYHTLTRKLLLHYKRFNSLEEIRNFYFRKCSVRVLRIDSVTKRKVMENVLIQLLEPR